MTSPHDCQPPLERRPIADDTWTCPDCGALWRARPIGPIDPAPSFDFKTGEGVSDAVWERVDSL